MTKCKLQRCCNQWQPRYQLEDGEKWPENGTSKYKTVLQLLLICHRSEKWDVAAPVDLSFV